MSLTENILSRSLKVAFLPIFVAFGGTSLAAESPVTPENFGRVVEGRTFSFFNEVNGEYQLAGNERYFPDQSVVFQPVNGSCLEGVWFERDGDICFDYGGAEHCWRLDSVVPEPNAVFSYRIGEHRQIAVPTETFVPQSCAPLLSRQIAPQSGLTGAG